MVWWPVGERSCNVRSEGGPQRSHTAQQGKQGHKHIALTLWLISESSILFAIADSEACHCCQFFCNPLFKLHYPLTNNEGRQLKSMSFFLSFKPWFICPDIIETHFQICSRDWWSKMPNSNFLRQTLLSVMEGRIIKGHIPSSHQ